MREILFRGIIKSDNSRYKRGQWAVGDLVRLQDGEDGKPHIYGCGEVFAETVGQYTGLTDKNGKKIFEGDIVNIYYPKVKVENTVISYIGASFYGDRFDDAWELDNYYQLEVIGNIHDNPELLKERDN